MEEFFRAALLFGAFLMVSTAPVQVKNAVTAKSMAFLETFGYLRRPDPRAGRLLSQGEVVTAIKKMQKYAGLPASGVIDNATAKLMNTSRCGLSDVVRADIAKRKRRYNIQGSKWKKQKVTWRVENYGNDGLSPAEVDAVIEKAFDKWASVANLEFTHLRSGQPDILFRFVRGAHGDPYPFDPDGTATLAHAFYPANNNAPLAGDVHFNDAVRFSIGPRRRDTERDLFWISVHEIGHSIGLDHSNAQGAIMYPYYSPPAHGSDLDLTPDDVRGIRALYGEKAITTPKMPAVSVKPYGSNCFKKMGAAFLGNDKRTYVFNSDKMYILRTMLGIDKGPIPVSQMFKGVTSVDAAFKRQGDRNTIIFSGKNYFVFRGDSEYVSGPTPISRGFIGFSDDFGDIDAAFVWRANNLLYIFKGNHYWRVYVFGAIYRVAEGYPREIKFAWGKVPNNIDAVMTWANGVTYFFKGEKFYRFGANLQVEDGYPKEIAPAWVRSGSCSPSGKLILSTNGSKSVMEVTLATLMMSIIVSILQLSS